MLYLLGKYGGFLTIILSWTTLIFPYLLLRKKRNLSLISQVVGKSFWGYVTKFGIILCGLTQLSFSYFLYQSFEGSIMRVGVVFYGIGSLSFLLCGLVDYYANTKVHRFLVKTYYFWMTIGFVLLSFQLSIVAKIFVLLLAILPSYYFLNRRNEIVAEFLAIIFSNLFALSIYYYLGILNFV